MGKKKINKVGEGNYKTTKTADKLKQSIWSAKHYKQKAKETGDPEKKGMYMDWANSDEEKIKKLRKELNMSETEYRALLFAEETSERISIKNIVMDVIDKDMDYRSAKEYAEKAINSKTEADIEPLSEQDVIEILEAMKAKSGKKEANMAEIKINVNEETLKEDILNSKD